MTIRTSRAVAMAFAIGLASPGPNLAYAQDANKGAVSSLPGWQSFIDRMQSLPDRMVAKLPAEQRDDPQVRAELGRLALAAVASTALETLGGDPRAPQFLPSIGQVLSIGQPNADTVYKTATIDPRGSYRLTGKRGSDALAVIAQVVPGAGARSHLDLATLKVDGDGRYALLVSAERPAGHVGDWWKLETGAARLMARFVASDWSREVDPTIAIERLDLPIGRPRPTAAELERRLRALPDAVDAIALLFVDHVAALRTQGEVNRFRRYDVAQGALQGQFYYVAPYALKDDEALIVESRVPAGCTYRSLILTNDIYETIDWYNNHSSLNGAQAAADRDGILRIVVSARDPGVRNWLDTAGYPTGVIQGRWTGCDSEPIPTARLVALRDVAKALPKDTARVTPRERQSILRERRRALQERRLW